MTILTLRYIYGSDMGLTFNFRLSDLLFTMARLAAHREGQEEKIYRRIYPQPDQ